LADASAAIYLLTLLLKYAHASSVHGAFHIDRFTKQLPDISALPARA